MSINYNKTKLDCYKKEVYYIGNLDLLKRRKISIVGSRKANEYSKQTIYKLSQKLSQNGFVIVSGGAIGIDTYAHMGAGSQNTIMISATGIDKRYPKTNANMIKEIEQNGLVLSEFEPNTPSNIYNFPIRNKLIVALGEVLIVGYADENSGTQRSIEFALKQNKDIYVLPHRLNESKLTHKLLQEQKVKPIYDIDSFLESFGIKENEIKDNFLEFCKTNPTFDEAVAKYDTKVYEYELAGKIKVLNGKIFLT